MARPKRNEVGAKLPPAPPRLTPEPTWDVAEKLRFWCPLCGMVADIDRLNESPYPVQVKLQRYGGKLPDGRGFIRYYPVNEETGKRVLERLEKIVAVLPSHLAGEAAAAAEIPDTFPGWVQKVKEENPELSNREAVANALSAALMVVSGFEAPAQELTERFGDALAGMSLKASFADVASAIGTALRARAEALPYLKALDREVVRVEVFDLSHFQVKSATEEEVAAEFATAGISPGTRRYDDYISQNAVRIVGMERDAFEAAKRRQFAEWDRRWKEWQEDIAKAVSLRASLDRDLDIATEVYTLADMRVPRELLEAVAEATDVLATGVEETAAALREARRRIEEAGFDEYMETYQGAIVKRAWEEVKRRR